MITNIVEELNEEFSGMSESQIALRAEELAIAITERSAKHNKFLAPNLQRRDVVLCLLMFGCNMPVIDLIEPLIRAELKNIRKAG